MEGGGGGGGRGLAVSKLFFALLTNIDAILCSVN